MLLEMTQEQDFKRILSFCSAAAVFVFKEKTKTI